MIPAQVTPRERFHALMAFQPVDRLPVLEWAGWWTDTIDRWHGEGLDPALTDRPDWNFNLARVFYASGADGMP